MSKRVVIAEDEAIIRLDLREMLEAEGYDVVAETGRGDEAVELVREHQPDLCVFDIKMPGLDGLSAAREISGDRQAAVVILTAFSQRHLIEQARDAGVLSYLVKPFQKEELVSAIEVALARFAEMRELDETVKGLEDQLETRKGRPFNVDRQAVAWIIFVIGVVAVRHDEVQLHRVLLARLSFTLNQRLDVDR